MRRLFALAIAGSLLGGSTLPRPSPRAVVETHQAMVDWINPGAIVISQVIGDAKSETEGLDPVLMDALAWDKIRRAAQSLEFSSRRMADAEVLKVGAHTAEVPGFANRAEIQAKLDADPQLFRKLSTQMADTARELGNAASTRNPRLTRQLADNLSESCQTCHTQYWEKPVS